MSSKFEFYFDEWATLAKHDPEEFERRRKQVVKETCDKMGGREAVIAGLCWRIDMERRRCATPMKLCLKLSSLMWDRFHDLRDELNVWRREM